MAKKQVKVKGSRLAWHVHHGKLFEPVWHSLASRRRYIRAHKPKRERAVRLRLLKYIKGPIPRAVTGAPCVYSNDIQHNHRMLVLHWKECPHCPWDGETIFPR